MWLLELLKNARFRLKPQQIDALEQLNPDKFYLENVRSLLGISAREAQAICDIAVAQGRFGKGIEVLSPDGTVAATALLESDLPRSVHYWIEDGADYVETEAPLDQLAKRSYYRLLHGE